jgi:hypothetical protein
VVFGWNSQSGQFADSGNFDLALLRDAAAVLQMGQDAATATAQTLKAHDGSGTDKDGANLTLAGGNPTGQGAGSSLIFNTTDTGGSTSSTQQTSTERARFLGKGQLRFSELATNPTAAELSSGSNAEDRVALYMANDKICFSYNRAGTVNYLCAALDGTSTSWTNGSSAP